LDLGLNYEHLPRLAHSSLVRRWRGYPHDISFGDADVRRPLP
jgi:hypothetical protein